MRKRISSLRSSPFQKKRRGKKWKIWEAAAKEDWDTVKHMLEQQGRLGRLRLLTEYHPFHFGFGTCAMIDVIAACNTDPELLMSLIPSDIEANLPRSFGISLLHWAAKYNSNLEIVEYLVSQGADINGEAIEGLLSLQCAACNPNLDILKWFISQGCRIEEKNYLGTTLLHTAVRENPNVEVAKYLVSQGIDVNTKDWHGRTALDEIEYNMMYDIDEREAIKNILREAGGKSEGEKRNSFSLLSNKHK